MLENTGVAMFLRRYTRTKDGKQHTYYALVESVRTDAGPRQQVVAYLGELNHDQQRRWQRTVVFHNRQGEAQQLRLFTDDHHATLPDDPDVVCIRLDSIGWTNGRRFGDVWLARWLWHYLHLDQIVARHLPHGKHTVAPADVVAIEVINRLCAPCSEFALAEHWYPHTALADLLGVPDNAVTKDRLYRTLDALLQAQQAIEDDLQKQFATLFDVNYDLLLYDLTSTYFEGLAEDNDLAQRGYSRDHRNDCKQVVVALVLTRDGFPLAHFTLAGNTQDVQTVKQLVLAVEKRFGQSQRVWVMDRGMISKETLKFLGKGQRRYLLATRRNALTQFQSELARGGWQRLPDNSEVEVKPLRRGRVHYLLARSKPRRQKERAMRRRQRRGLAQTLRQLHAQIAAGRLKKRDKVLERVGRLKARYPKGCPFVTITVASRGRPQVSWSWHVGKFKAALAADGAYLLRSNYSGWSAEEFWETYIQLTVVEHAFRVLKSELLRKRPADHVGVGCECKGSQPTHPLRIRRLTIGQLVCCAFSPG
jgi:Transposase DDE domain